MNNLDIIAVQEIITSFGSSMMELVGKISSPEIKLPYSTTGEINISNERMIVDFSITAYNTQLENLPSLNDPSFKHAEYYCPEAGVTLQIVYQGELTEDEHQLLTEHLSAASDALVALGGYNNCDKTHECVDDTCYSM